jgi:aspartokinase-like uncharacterized kinase
LREALDASAAEVVKAIQSDGVLDESNKTKLLAAIKAYAQSMTPKPS